MTVPALDRSFLPPPFRIGGPLEGQDSSALCDHLRGEGGAVLAGLTIAEIVELLDEVARIWMDGRAPDQEAVVEAMASHTGLSLPMVVESLRAEQASSTGDEIWKALRSELGDPAMLDRFIEAPESGFERRAFGPELLLAIAPGNIPALSHLPLMRSLLVKAPCLIKASSTEPVYAAAYCRSLESLHPPLAHAMAALHWKGGDDPREEAFLRAADAVVVYGGPATCRSVAARVREGTRLHVHGHRLGFACLGPVAPSKAPGLAEALARDVAMFDQQACLSPHWIFVEGQSLDELLPLGQALVHALARIQLRWPRGRALDGGTELSRFHDELEAAELMGEPLRLLSQGRDDPYAVFLDGRLPLRPGPGGRSIALVPYADEKSLFARLRPLAAFMQNVGLWHVDAEARMALAEGLARLGPSRICPIGAMAYPSMAWRHDGRPCLGDLLRFCDMEPPPR